MIEIKNLSYQFAQGKAIAFPDFVLEKGGHMLILGKSGVGKTTLLHLLALILTPKTGSLFIHSEEINKLSEAKLVKFRAKTIGTVYQKPHFVAALSVYENIQLASYLSDNQLNIKYLNDLADSLGLTNLLNKKVSRLSLGEQQRVSIARALINNPAIILADEPTSNLDDENCRNVVELLQKQSNKIGACLIIVTHDQRLKSVFENQITLLSS